jgi:hypothetical protein
MDCVAALQSSRCQLSVGGGVQSKSQVRKLYPLSRLTHANIKTSHQQQDNPLASCWLSELRLDAAAFTRAQKESRNCKTPAVMGRAQLHSYVFGPQGAAVFLSLRQICWKRLLFLTVDCLCSLGLESGLRNSWAR